MQYTHLIAEFPLELDKLKLETTGARFTEFSETECNATRVVVVVCSSSSKYCVNSV